MLRKIATIAAVASLTGALPVPLHAQPATAPAPPGAEGGQVQRLRAVITGIDGTVQVRDAEDQPWRRAEVGMVLDEGAEFRTGIRSAVRFEIPPGQVVTLDRLGVVKLVTAVREADKVTTDLGMTYGRTRYDVEAAGLEHSGTIRSPGATLAIRGTEVNLYDQPPYNVEARSLTGRALYKTRKQARAVGIGNRAGRTERAQGDAAPAQTRLTEQFVDPTTSWGNTGPENLLLLSLQSYGGNSFKNLGVLSLLDAARTGDFEGSVVGSLPVGQLLSFSLSWSGSPFSDLDLQIVSPLGETLSAGNPSVPSSGTHGGNNIAGEAGFGQESALWTVSFPRGTYTLSVDLVSGDGAEFDIFVIQDPEGSGRLIANPSGAVDGETPHFSTTIQAPGQSIGETSVRSAFKSRNARAGRESRADRHHRRRR